MKSRKKTGLAYPSHKEDVLKIGVAGVHDTIKVFFVPLHRAASYLIDPHVRMVAPYSTPTDRFS